MAFPWLPVAIFASSVVNALASGGKNKPTEYTSGLDPQSQQFRNMLGQYLTQKMNQPWLTAQPNQATPMMMNMLMGQYFRDQQGNPMSFQMPGLTYGGSQFGQPYTGGGAGGAMPSRGPYPGAVAGGYRSPIRISDSAKSSGNNLNMANLALGGLPYAASKAMGKKGTTQAFGAIPWLLSKIGL